MEKYKIVYKLRDWINKDKLHWWSLSENSNAMHLLEEEPDNIDWYLLTNNPSIFEIDYMKTKKIW